jgi:autotransporter translocation and assembly factor TamB
MSKKIAKILFSVVAVCILAAGGIIAIAQTSWFKSKLEKVLFETAKKSGWSLSIGQLRGSIPLKWEIDDLSLVSPDGISVKAQNLKMRLALLPLLHGDFGIAYFSTDKIIISGGMTGKEPATKILFDQLEKFPFNISVRYFCIEKLEYTNLQPLQLKGSFKIQEQARNLFLKIQSQSNGIEQEVFAVGGTKKGRLEVHLKIRADRWSQFHDMKCQGQADISGPWNTWKAIASGHGNPVTPLTGEIFGRVDRFTMNQKTWESPWKVRLSFEVGADWNFTLKNALLQGPLANLQAEAKVMKNGSIKEAKYSLKIPSLTPFSDLLNLSLDGSLIASGTIKNGTSEGSIDILEGRLGALHFQTLHSSSSLFLHEEEWKGTVRLSADEKNIHLKGESALRLAKGQIYFSDFNLSAPELNLGGDLSFNYKTREAEGTLRLQATDLSALDPFLPQNRLGGQAGFEIHFLKNEAQTIKAFGTIANFHMSHLNMGEATVAINIQIANGLSAGDLEFHGEQIYLPDVYISNVDLQAQGQQTWNFTMNSQGTWKEPFHLLATGTYTPNNESKQFLLDRLEGTFLSHSVKLKDTSSLAIAKDHIAIELSSLQLGNGNLSLQYFINQTNWELKAKAEDTPLACFTLFTPWMSLVGDASLSCSLKGDSSATTGTCQLNMKNVNAKRFGSQPLFQANGSLLANFNGKMVQVHSELYAANGQAVLLDGSIPLRILENQYFPLRIDSHSSFSSSLLLEGKLEEFSEFFNTGFHRWKGWIAGKIIFSNTLVQPMMHGNLTISQGIYENDYLGLKIENVEATIEAARDEFFLTALKATGPDKEGVLEGTGNFRLRPDYNFPYRFLFKIDRFPTISLDLVEATLTGSGEIEGTSQKAILRGILDINEASFSIPRSLPADIPDLPVTYVNQPAHVETSLSNLPYIFPFHFDIAFHSTDSIHFNAGGLTSLWGGDFHLHGVNFNLLASGNLRLTKGQISLLGKTFQLNQGEISFSDKPGQEGLINISGTLNMNDVIITAQLRGTLTAPQLTLQSVPPMTTSDIFSLILFNKKVAEIKPMQAVQLARTIMAMSISSGWNFVDQIGSGLNILGIDTFDVIPSEQGLNQTSITIGKHFYLVRGVLVSLTQSLSSSRFLVEVDLGKGLIFQAENESDENQAGQVGKFSLKWNKNY